jgi:CHAT domain-containing protein
MYSGAEVYGLNKAPNGPATSGVILGALPGSDRQGASLFHLTTHGFLTPESSEPVLQTRDGTLPLARILGQARGRVPDAPGGLVITNACLTDVTLTGYDESLTLATAFLAAGATAVIATRWPVDEDTTSALAVRIHHQLQRGYPPADALRRAQLDLLQPGPEVRQSLGPQLAVIKDSRLSHPASWAGHVHHGI